MFFTILLLYLTASDLSEENYIPPQTGRLDLEKLKQGKENPDYPDEIIRKRNGASHVKENTHPPKTPPTKSCCSVM